MRSTERTRSWLWWCVLPVLVVLSGAPRAAHAAAPAVTTFQVTIAASGGQIAHSKASTATQYAGNSFITVTAPHKAAYAGGTHRATLLVSGQATATATFRVGG